jgi:hypothetical protein
MGDVLSKHAPARARASQLLGIEKREDEIDRYDEGDGAAEDEIEHGRPQAFAAQRA